MNNWHEMPEAYVVGAALLDHTVMDDVAGDLLPSHFGHAALRRIYSAQVRLWEGGESFTLADVMGLLSDEDQAIAEDAYAQQATAANAAHYARQIRKEHDRREIMRVAASIMDKARDRSVDPDIVVKEAASSLHMLVRGDEKEFVTLGKTASTFVKDLEARCASGAPVGIETPFFGLDRKIVGWEPQLMYVLGARPSVGKSALGVQIGMRAAKVGSRVLYMLLETSREQWVRRVVSGITGVSTVAMKRGEVPTNKWPDVMRCMAMLDKVGDQVTLGKVPGCTPAKLRAEAMRLQRSAGLDLLIIDYVQLMKPDVKVNSRVEAMVHVSQEVLSIAETLDIPVIALAQLGRDVQGTNGEMRRPVLTDLKESGQFEQDAAVVMFLHRENLMNNNAELLISKQRDGPIGKVDLTFNHESITFEEKRKA